MPEPGGRRSRDGPFTFLLVLMPREGIYCHNRRTTAEEMASAFGCDGLMERPDHVWFRAIDVAAPAELTFRWLTQLRVAPYSYDWIDNLGRQSPRELLELPPLEVGQRAMIVFEVASFEHGGSLDLRLRQPWWVRIWAAMVMSYRVDRCEDGTRIVVKMLTRFPATPLGWMMRVLLPHGDWFMMRKQLRTFKALVEQSRDSSQ